MKNVMKILMTCSSLFFMKKLMQWQVSACLSCYEFWRCCCWMKPIFFLVFHKQHFVRFRALPSRSSTVVSGHTCVMHQVKVVLNSRYVLKVVIYFQTFKSGTYTFWLEKYNSKELQTVGHLWLCLNVDFKHSWLTLEWSKHYGFTGVSTCDRHFQ